LGGFLCCRRKNRRKFPGIGRWIHKGAVGGGRPFALPTGALSLDSSLYPGRGASAPPQKKTNPSKGKGGLLAPSGLGGRARLRRRAARGRRAYRARGEAKFPSPQNRFGFPPRHHCNGGRAAGGETRNGAMSLARSRGHFSPGGHVS